MQLEALAPDGQRLTAWPSSSSTREAKRLTHGRLRGAYLQLPAPKATALVLVEGPVDALAARWLHPGAVVFCCGGALRLDPGELPAGVQAVLIEADAVRRADEIGRGLQAAGVAVCIGERGRGDVAEALAGRPGRRGRVRLATLRRRPVRVVGPRRPRGQADPRRRGPRRGSARGPERRGSTHELWRDADPQPRHPLAPLVRAWWKWPVEVEDRNDRRAGNLFSPAVWTATQESGQFDFFPGFGPGAGRLLRRPAGQAPGAVARSVGVVRLYIEVFYAIRRSARLRP